MAKENQEAVKNRIDRAFFSKGKSTSKENPVKKQAALNEAELENLLNFDDEEPVVSHRPAKRPSPPVSFSPKKVEEMDKAAIDVDVEEMGMAAIDVDVEEMGMAAIDVDVEEPKESASSDLPQSGRNLMKEYESNVLPAKEISLDEEDALRLIAEDEANELDEPTELEISQMMEMDITEPQEVSGKVMTDEKELNALLDLVNQGMFLLSVVSRIWEGTVQRDNSVSSEAFATQHLWQYSSILPY